MFVLFAQTLAKDHLKKERDENDCRTRTRGDESNTVGTKRISFGRLRGEAPRVSTGRLQLNQCDLAVGPAADRTPENGESRPEAAIGGI